MKILGPTTIIAPLVLILLTIWMAFALASPASAQVGGGYYAAPAPWWGPQRYGIPSGPQCRSNTGIRRPGWCGGLRYDGSGPPPANIPIPPAGGAYPPVSYPLPPPAYYGPIEMLPPVNYYAPPPEEPPPPAAYARKHRAFMGRTEASPVAR